MTTIDQPRGRLSTVLVGLGSTALLVALVVGSPVALVAWGRAEELSRLTPASLSAPDDGSLLLGMATVVGWFAWLVFTVCVVAEILEMVSGSRLRIRIPGFGQVQGLAAGMLVASLALLAPLGGAEPSSQAGSMTRTMTPDGVDGVVATGAAGGGEASRQVASGATAGGIAEGRRIDMPVSQVDSRAQPGAAHHRVGPTDSIWSVAQYWYGDGTAWRRIAAANPGLDPAHLPVGSTITIPAVPPAGETPTALPSSGDGGRPAGEGPRVVVRRGDTLSGLALRHLGDAERWPEIWNLNRDRIADPDLIDIGWRLILPADRPGTPNGGSAPAPGGAASQPREQDDRQAPASTPASPAPTRTAPADSAPEQAEPERAGPEGPAPERSASHRTGAPTVSSTAPGEAAGSSDRGTPGGKATAAPPASSGVGSAELPPTGAEVDSQPIDLSAVRTALAGLSLFLAGGIAGALVVGRRRQLFSRPLGRRVPVIGEPAAGLRAMLEVASDVVATSRPGSAPEDSGPEDSGPEDSGPQQPDPEMADENPSPPGRGLADPPAAAGTELPEGGVAPEISPTTVVLGTRLRSGDDGVTPSDAPVLLDLAETSGWLGIDGSRGDAAQLVAGIALSLTCTWWSEGLEVLACGDSLSWLSQTGNENVTVVGFDEIADDLMDTVHIPRPLFTQWPPVERVVLLDAAPSGLPDPRLLRGAGVVVVSPVPVPSSDSGGQQIDGSDLVRVNADETATLGDLTFAAQLVGAPVRRGVVDLLATASRTDTEPAGWWHGESPPGAGSPRRQMPPDDSFREQSSQLSAGGSTTWEGQVARRADTAPIPTAGRPTTTTSRSGPPAISRSGSDSQTEVSISREVTVSITADGVPQLDPGGSAGLTTPMLRLLGPVDLVGARGPEPSRGVRQALECCGWILWHPGSTSTRMREGLLVAEPTRRSNLSRLRRWLGRDDAGRLYLPEAYDGVIELDDAVASDWERLQVLITGGIARAPDASLRAALDLVRGAPLADAAPGQWHWAEEWRVEMMQTVRDIGVERARRAIAAGELDTARLALARALVCCPEDEELLAARIRLAHLAGERAELERLVYLLSRRARRLGVDLSEETVVLLQEVMEGRPRARVV
ncbi:LysM peptidoglycan-binding domain-containing protein [Acidipropionibacterium thoenii]|uniref:LysM peptidoglycan-binding domain-containing protein n=1 Tax=Acidipropionibacterium thoenii TaxID=1751 RepID=UPI00041342CE|nr:LysM peptidoglycan-binding domain-containing protein [Acidipropionibacterium thoenii]